MLRRAHLPILAAVLFVVALGVATGFFLPDWGPIGSLVGAVMVLLAAGRHWKNLLWKKMDQQKLAVAEVRALLELQDPRFSTPLPWSGWSLPPSVIREVLRTLDMKDAEIVVDCGSGLSTIYIALFLKARGHGRVIALDHDQQWTGFVNRLLERHGLEPWAEIHCFPLAEREFYGLHSIWYSIPELPLGAEEEVDLILVDGPPGAAGRLARLGAVPFFWSRLAHDAVIFLDDTRRRDEREIVEIWCREHPLEASQVATEHQTVKLVRREETT